MELCIMIQMLQNVLIKAFLERLAQQTVANNLSLTGRARDRNISFFIPVTPRFHRFQFSRPQMKPVKNMTFLLTKKITENNTPTNWILLTDCLHLHSL